METRPEQDAARLRLRPEPEMTIYAAAALKPVLLDALARAAEVEIDLAGVGELDTSGVQLLMLAKRQAAASGKRLVLTGHSPAVLEVMELLGLAAWFGDPQVLPAGHPGPAGARA